MAELGLSEKARIFFFSLSNEAKLYLLGSILGLVLIIGGGVVITAEQIKEDFSGGGKIEIISSEEKETETVGQVVVDVSGAVFKPGVYVLEAGARVSDVLTAAGGLAGEADRVWVDKHINLAQKVSDGAKIYIPWLGESVGGSVTGQNSGLVEGVSSTLGEERVNINTASAAELDKLWGIGPKRAEDIIGSRPYTSVEELLERKVIPEYVYERIKEEMVVF